MLVICFKHEITFLFDKGKSFDLGDNFEFQSTDVIIFFFGFFSLRTFQLLLLTADYAFVLFMEHANGMRRGQDIITAVWLAW